MPKTKVKLLRPLNGEEIGTIKSYDTADAKRLAESGAVRILGPAKSDSLTVKSTATKPKTPSAAQRRAKAKGAAPANKAKGAAASNKAS